MIFEKETASIKIACIKEEYSSEYWYRIFTCIGISIILIGAFTIINTGLNYLLKWFYKKDKKFTSEIENYETIDNLRQQLADSIDKRNKLETDVENLTKINQNLNFKSKEISISDIAKRDYKALISKLSTFEHKEKLLYSLKELMEILKNKPDIVISEINNKATYVLEMEELISILTDVKLVREEFAGYGTFNEPEMFLKIGTSFKEFLKMDI